MERSQFTFYASFYQAISRIGRKAARADVYDAICAYALYGIEPEPEALGDMAAIAFYLIKPNLDASKNKALNRLSREKNKCPTNGQQKSGKDACEGDYEGEGEKKSDIKCENQCYNTGVEDKEADFNAFWSLYPKKVGKVEARRAFQQVQEPVDTLLRAVRQQNLSDQWCRADGQFIPNPATWLKQKRWEDILPRSGIPKGASGVLGQAELEAIQQVLKEGEEYA